MKKTYESPILEIVNFDEGDFITTSGIVNALDIPGDGD